jgi:enoyl-CoA hydratase/carnithine racemase
MNTTTTPATHNPRPLLAEIRNGVGYLTLNRPAALNTINISMVRDMHAALTQWEQNSSVKAVVVTGHGGKAFCAGGDVRRVHECITQGLQEYHEFFKEEFSLNEYIYTYPKPYIAMMNGIVMGGGMGISQGAAFRIVNETTRIAMPETAIGYFPDVGASYFLTRDNTSIAKYLGLSGKNLNHKDALFCKLADWTLPQEKWTTFLSRLESIDGDSIAMKHSIQALLTELGGSKDFESSVINDQISLIEEIFSESTLQAIFQALEKKSDHPWAQETKSNMMRNSPLAMAATLQLLTQGEKLNLSDCFSIELELTKHWLTKGEFAEGVRAALIDKDKNPKWKYSILDVVPSLINEQFPVLFSN